MPFSFWIDDALDILFIQGDGLLTPELLHDCVSEYVADPGFHPEIDTVFEIGEEVEIEIGGQQVRPVDIAREAVVDEESAMNDLIALSARSRKGRPHRMACVGGSVQERAFFMAGIGLVSPKEKIAAFDERSSALEWLGKDEGSQSPH